jgi:hypothetical protein
MHAISTWSLPTKWSLLSFLFLIIICTAALIKYLLGDFGIRDLLSAVLVIVPLILIIPSLVYAFVNYLLMPERSLFPDLDEIWNEALQEAQSKGVPISGTPIFLILGTSNSREIKTVLEQMKLDFVVNTSSSGSQPLSVHASREGFFLFLNGVSCVSRLAGSSVAPRISPQSDFDSEPSNSDVGGTIDASMLSPRLIPKVGDHPPGQNHEPSTPGGTMLLDENQDIGDVWKAIIGSRQLSSRDITDCDDRLRHVCGLINRSRRPLCPINGIVTAMPFELIESSSAQLQIAIQKDLAVLREELQVRCPNSALVIGMEVEDGFIELIKRLPPQQSTDNRFGKGSDLWVAPDEARLEAIAAHATATFEDWIYMLFQESNALAKQHNSRLFMMLCRVRGVFAENLRSVLARGFGFNPQTEPGLAYEQFLFGGCYFAATGTSPNQQAFIKSVFAKVLQQEGELEWAPQARQQDGYYAFLANLAALLGTVAFVAIVAMLLHKFWFTSTP